MGRKKAQDSRLDEEESYRVSSTETLLTGHCVVSAELIIDEEGEFRPAPGPVKRITLKVLVSRREDETESAHGDHSSGFCVARELRISRRTLLELVEQAPQ